MSQNKPLHEYGDLHSQHHSDRQREEQATPEQNDEPPQLVVTAGPGNLVVIKWTKGSDAIPHNCEGAWNHKGKAQEAIDGANARIIAESNAAAKAADDARIQALADAEAVQAAIDITEEKERIQAQIDKDAKDRAEAEKATVVAPKATPKKTTTKK